MISWVILFSWARVFPYMSGNLSTMHTCLCAFTKSIDKWNILSQTPLVASSYSSVLHAVGCSSYPSGADSDNALFWSRLKLFLYPPIRRCQCPSLVTTETNHSSTQRQWPISIRLTFFASGHFHILSTAKFVLFDRGKGGVSQTSAPFRLNLDSFVPRMSLPSNVEGIL